jgi:hypothetical protein
MTLGSKLKIHLEGAERIWCVRKRPLRFDRAEVLRAAAGKPEQSWRELRIPGTALPGVIKAGTYLTPRGCEFWYVTRKYLDCALTIRVDHARYRAVVLGVAEPETWAQRINEWVEGKSRVVNLPSWMPWAHSSSRL